MVWLILHLASSRPANRYKAHTIIKHRTHTHTVSERESELKINRLLAAAAATCCWQPPLAAAGERVRQCTNTHSLTKPAAAAANPLEWRTDVWHPLTHFAKNYVCVPMCVIIRTHKHAVPGSENATTKHSLAKQKQQLCRDGVTCF